MTQERDIPVMLKIITDNDLVDMDEVLKEAIQRLETWNWATLKGGQPARVTVKVYEVIGNPIPRADGTVWFPTAFPAPTAPVPVEDKKFEITVPMYAAETALVEEAAASVGLTKEEFLIAAALKRALETVPEASALRWYASVMDAL